VLTAYFDESGHIDTPGYFSIGALVAPSAAWGPFSQAWRQALQENDAPYLHMREFAHRRGPYQGWKEEQRRALLAACVSAINESRAVAVGKSGLQDPYLCCFQETVRGAAINGVYEPEGLKVEMVFSTQDEHAGHAKLLHESLLKTSDVKERIGPLRFAPMTDELPLQAADLIAYELRHHYHLGAIETPPPTRWPFKEIVTHQRTVLGARMLKYIPAWVLQAQAEGVYQLLMQRIISDPELMFAYATQSYPDLR
jgi:hypothetical protein